MSVFSAFLFESFLTAFQFLCSKDINIVQGGEGSRKRCRPCGFAREETADVGERGAAAH